MTKSRKKSRGKIQVNFQISILITIILVLCITSLSFLFSVLTINRKVGINTAGRLFDEFATVIEFGLDAQMQKAVQFCNLMRALPAYEIVDGSDGTDYSGLPFMFEVLDSDPYLYSIYAGSGNGEFIQLIAAHGNRMIPDVHKAPADTEYLLRTISGQEGERIQRWIFLDKNKKVFGRRLETQPDFNPAVRPWFLQSRSNPEKTLLTAPYVFNSLQKPGITASAALPGVDKVVGVDLTLEGIENVLNDMHATGETGLMVLDNQDRILAANGWMKKNLDIPPTPLVSLTEIDEEKYNLILNGNDVLNKIIPWMFSGDNEYKLIISAPLVNFLEHQKVIQRNVITIALLILACSVPLIFLVSRSFSTFINNLAADAARIQNLDFSGRLPGHSVIKEFNELSGAFGVMKRTLSGRTRALESARGKLENIIDLGIAMSVEKNPDKLFELILKGAKEIAHADGGSLYLKNDDDILEFRIVLNDTLNFEQGGTSGSPITMPGVPMFGEEGLPNYKNVVSYACNKCETVVIDDAYETENFDFSGTRKFDEMNNYRSMSILTVPLKLPGSEVMGAIQLLNCKNTETGNVVPFSLEVQRFSEALSAEAAAILHNRNLLKAQEQLFESLIQLIANAIDTKSPYTGGHCNRVPELALMLAEEAERTDSGALADFKFKNEDERRAFRIGAWLHDAGKITTPEFVVDKAVKLETIYNRIHEIRTRFEVILRDIWLEEKEAVINGGELETAAERRRAKEAELFEDFNFIAACNRGDYNAGADLTGRLESIAAKTWYGHFNHTIGLSADEETSLRTSFKEGSSVKNQLLADKPEHLIKHPEGHDKIYQGYDFRLSPPEYLYNRGELYNLSIPRGTLTAEERFKITEHIMQTIVMLDKLPLPKALSDITRFAGEHHETLDGKGYPRGLDGEQLSIPSRVLAIADIFEALTASDRPYKKAKTLSEAISILKEFKERKHIDADLFRLFLESGIYRKYAAMYLREDQIDEIDISQYLD